MTSNEWKVAGTFVTGISHERQNIGCHDRFSYKYANNATSISIADGAGSAKYPAIGAEIASRQVNNTITKDFDWLFNADANDARHKITHAIRTIIGIHAKKQNSIIKDFATTLIFASVKDDKFIAGHIGDGILACLVDNELKMISPPENGEFINETYFITSKSYKSRFRIFKGYLENIKGFVLMTDGTCESLFDKQNKCIAPIVLTLFDWLDNYPMEEVNKALKENFENVIKRKTTDDCSIGLLKLACHNLTISENDLQNK
jgi:serine/threonine protein phosphatase PrpC